MNLRARLSRLGQARKAAVEKQLRRIPESYRQTYLRACTSRSAQEAITGFCLQCKRWWRHDVARCSALECPLYPHRPFQDLDDRP